MTAFIGVDPGASGALAMFEPGTGHLEVVDMPTVLVTIGKKNRNRVDMHALANLLQTWAPHAEFAVIEEVHSTPNDGPVGAFAFGEAFGAVKMAVAAAAIPYQLVPPPQWKSAFKLLKQDKDASRQRASQLLPKHAKNWSRKMDDGRAEAALIALYGAMLKGKWK
jgi:crossover junction endodeoxyribonuclease RuvC